MDGFNNSLLAAANILFSLSNKNVFPGIAATNSCKSSDGISIPNTPIILPSL